MESRQQKTSPIMAYLFQPVESKSTIKETFYNGAMTAAFDHLAQRLVLRAYDQLESLNRSGKREEAWNETSIELTKVSLQQELFVSQKV
jgi:hypothetical protein